MENKNKKDDLAKKVNDTISDNDGNKEGGINGFVQKNGKMIIIASVAVIILVGLILLFNANSKKNEANAAKALARIEQYYTRGEYQTALHGNDTLPLVRGEKVIGLVSIINEYSSTSAGNRAMLYAADSYYMLGKYSEAKNYYEKAIKSSIDVIKIGGLAGTAACDEKMGKIKEASEGYLKAANIIDDDVMKMRYLYFAGLCNEKSGNSEEAIKIYRSIVDLNKYGEFNNQAKAGIVRLGKDID